MENGPCGSPRLVLLFPAQELFRSGNVLEMGRLQIRLPGEVQGGEIQCQAYNARARHGRGNPAAEARQVEKERAHVESLYKEELAREADRAIDVTYVSYKDEFSRMQDCIADGLLYCLNKSKVR